ncbi:AcrR family transcriptional regulator [Aeromicrobium panaciterrae]|uniref:AcrR family transcriptional regulator n=1 Tax=Aeromicrobium panaciterrae TaxID=363861 RepID=A0ABU1UKL5_9ACTN|nr:TetR family transcriptional regulator [Aeromicrobium panaciterrae]MDR7085705.1 AcrR family transcriptional regulator [Aeromicrobium panaciterrae]
MSNSLDDVVSGALGVLDTHGLEFCSMRRVASALGVQPSALYHHVPDKQTLLALMADRIVADVHAPVDGSREQRALAVCHGLRDAMLSIRDGADVVATASAFRLGASGIESDLAEVLGDRDGARTLLLYVFGHTQATQDHRLASAVGVLEADPDLDASFDRGLAIVMRGLAD